MRIRQYVYFAADSFVLSPSDLTGRLGIEPDKFLIRGSKAPIPPLPRTHMWEVRCDTPGLGVSEQITRVMARLVPYRDRIEALGQDLARQAPPGRLWLQVVRFFDDEAGEEENEREFVDADGQGWKRLPGQHQLLSWHLESDVLAFLHSVGAELDVDEYG